MENYFGGTSGDYTYLMKDGYLSKIGKSRDPEKRLKAMKTARPKLRLITYSMNVSEKDMHRKYKKYNVGGEWFRLPWDIYKEAAYDLCPDGRLSKLNSLLKEEKIRINKYKNIKNKNKNRKKNLGLDGSPDEYRKHIIQRGRYKGVNLIDMKNDEQIRFLNNIVKASKKDTFAIKAIKWWLGMIKNYREMKELMT